MPTSREQRDRIARREGMKQCPSCAEFIRSEASVCRYCGRQAVLPEPRLDEDALDREWEKLNRS